MWTWMLVAALAAKPVERLEAWLDGALPDDDICYGPAAPFACEMARFSSSPEREILEVRKLPGAQIVRLRLHDDATGTELEALVRLDKIAGDWRITGAGSPSHLAWFEGYEVDPRQDGEEALTWVYTFEGRGLARQGDDWLLVQDDARTETRSSDEAIAFVAGEPVRHDRRRVYDLQANLNAWGVKGSFNHVEGGFRSSFTKLEVLDLTPVEDRAVLTVRVATRDGQAERVWLADRRQGELRVVAHLGAPDDPDVVALREAFEAGTLDPLLVRSDPTDAVAAELTAAATAIVDQVPPIERRATRKAAKTQLSSLRAMDEAFAACSNGPAADRAACEAKASAHEVQVGAIDLYRPDLAVVSYEVSGWRTKGTHRIAFVRDGTWQAVGPLTPPRPWPGSDPVADGMLLLKTQLTAH